MIELTRFDGSRFFVNVDYIEFIETTPDTIVSLIDHKKLLVRESAVDVCARIHDYRLQYAPQLPAMLRAMMQWNQNNHAEGHDGPEHEHAHREELA